MKTEKKSTQFWKQVSSRLRTTLNVIKGTADLAQTEIYDIETVKEGFSTIEESSDYLLNVVNDIVDFVTIENADLEILHQPFNLNTLINEFIAKYFNISRNQHKYFDTQIHEVVHENLLGDAARVEQIIECMLDNSLKYSGENDQLYFRIYETGVLGEKACMRFTLTGTNTTIFERLQGTVNEKVITDETDLALYNSHYILSQMGGSIEVRLTEEQESEIVIDIGFELPDEKEKKEADGLFETEKVLIVCDRREEAEERGSILSEMHVSYDVATKEDEALEAIGAAEVEGQPYTVCVVDWNAEGFGLQDFVNDVHNIYGKQMPIIAMAYNVEQLEEPAKRMGFDYVMKKPWFRSTIFDVLMKNQRGKLKNYGDFGGFEKRYDFTGRKILVAEDAPLNRDLILQVLTKARADVVCAENGMEAYLAFKQKPEGYFDCVLMDVNMPEMNGYEATRKIRTSGREDAKTLPIYALTANAFQSDIKETLSAGMNGHFSKPVNVGNLYSTLEKLFAMAEEALHYAKGVNDKGCCILYDKTARKKGDMIEDFLNKTVFGTEMYYVERESISQVDRVEELVSLILGNNQAVGILCGTCEEKLPICSISYYALKNLGYDFESFVRDTDAKFENILYPDELDSLKSEAGEHELEVRKLRCRHKNGNVLWFNAAYVSTISRDGKKIWIASLRPFDEDMVGKLCNLDYSTVSIIFHKENTILLEKGVETVYIDDLKLRKKYNYESLIKNVLVKMHKEGEREEYLYNTSIQNLVTQIEKKGIYEFIMYQVREDNSCIPIRYKYRYLDEAKDSILWTQEYVENFAEKDDITSLLNEKGFYQTVKRIISDPENQEKEYSIGYVNIKDFKSYNELLGYANGNIILRKCAELFEQSPLAPVCGARFHADQYYYLFERNHLDYEVLSGLCHRRMTINGNLVNLHFNCGIYPIDERNQEVTTMCDKAVIAEDNISNEYAAPYYVFDESVNRYYQNRVFVLNNLDRAFEKNEFHVYFQPVCDTKTGRICSAEALIRWIMPGGKMISPGAFVPVLEKRGFISRLDLLVAAKVNELMERREKQGKRNVPVSINLSRMDFMNEIFLKELKNQVEHLNVSPTLFRYEVTESAYINVGEDGKKLLDELREMKSLIYMDDFGTGYSSLQNMMETHFDVLKLDMYFIKRIGKNPIAEGVIDNVVKICHSLGRKVIAEGVETEEQYQFLLAKECDYIQGYYFYKGLPEAEFERLVDEQSEMR